MPNKEQKKPFKLFSLDRLIRKGVVAVSLKDLILQARNLFNLDRGHQIKIVLEEDGTEIHSDDYLFSLENHTKLIILEQSDKWMASLPPKGMNNFEVSTDFKEIKIDTMGEDRCYSRHFVFHPEEAVFALTENRCSQVNFYKAKDFYVPICNWKNEKLIKLFISNSQISSMKWNGDGSQICVCCKDGTLVVWSYPLCDTLLKIQQSTYYQSIHWNPFDKNSFSNLVKSAEDGVEIIFWESGADFQTANLASKFMPPKTESIGEVIWISENQVAVETILGDYSKIEIREIVEDEGKLNSARLIKKLNWGNFSCIEYDLSTEYFATGSEESRTLNIWSMECENPVYSLKLNEEFKSIDGLFWLNTGETNAGKASARKSSTHMTLMCISDNRIILWKPIEEDLNRQKRIACRVPDYLDYTVSPFRKYLALMTTNQEIMLWCTKTWTLLFTSEPRDFQSTDVSFSWLFGRRSKKNYLKLVVTNGKEIRFFEGFL